MSLLLMKERIKQSGSTLYDEQIKDAQDILAYGFKDDVSYTRHIFFWIPGEDPRKGEPLDIKLYERKYSSANGNSQKFLTQHTDKVEVGDYIYNESEDTYWICTEAFDVDGIHYEGKLTQCNWHLRWQRPDGTILEYPCQDLNSSQSNSGESGNNTIKIGSAQHMEIVQATEDTMALASPQRFYISRTNDTSYIVTQNDTTANNYGKGLCNIIVTQDVKKGDRDRPDLGICDYIEPSTPLPPQHSLPNKTTDMSASISGNRKLKCGYSRTFTVNFIDKNGNVVDWKDVNFDWNIVSDFDVKQTATGNQINISVASDVSLVGKFILLQTLVNNEVISEIQIEIVKGW